MKILKYLPIVSRKYHIVLRGNYRRKKASPAIIQDEIAGSPRLPMMTDDVPAAALWAGSVTVDLAISDSRARS